MDEQPENSNGEEQQQTDTVTEPESQDQTKKHTISRRQFLIISAITGGVAGTGLLIGFNVIGRQGKTGKGTPTPRRLLPR